MNIHKQRKKTKKKTMTIYKLSKIVTNFDPTPNYTNEVKLAPVCF